jgi:hypothetical protein
MGAELNAETERQTDKETKQQGQRGSRKHSENESSPADDLRKKERQRRGWEEAEVSDQDAGPSEWVPRSQ